MKKNPFIWILKKRKWSEKDLDEAFDLLISVNTFNGAIGGNALIEESREAWEVLKKAIKTTPLN